MLHRTASLPTANAAPSSFQTVTYFLASRVSTLKLGVIVSIASGRRASTQRNSHATLVLGFRMRVATAKAGLHLNLIGLSVLGTLLLL